MADISDMMSVADQAIAPPPVASSAPSQTPNDSATGAPPIVVHAAPNPKLSTPAAPNNAVSLAPQGTNTSSASQEDPTSLDWAFRTMDAAKNGTQMPDLGPPPAINSNPLPEAPFEHRHPIAMSEVPADVAKGAVSGVEQGTLGLAGFPGLVSNALTKGGDWAFAHAMGSLGLLPGGQTADQAMAGAQKVRDELWQATPSSLTNIAEKVQGPLYQAKSVPGQYAQTIGNFIPATMMGGSSGIASGIANSVLPAVGAETLGQATMNTSLEPYARMAGAVIGGGAQGIAQAGLNAFKSAPDIAAAQAAQRTGVAMPTMALSGNPGWQRIAQGLKNLPFAGTPIEHASNQAYSDILGAAKNASELPTGAAVTPDIGGQSMIGGLSDFIGPSSRAAAKAEYDKVGTLVDPNLQLPLDNTANAVSEIMAKRSAARLDSGKAVDTVSNAVLDPTGLTYDGIKTLRTNVGGMLKGGRLPEGMDQGELKQIYGGLTKDLNDSAAANGPAALAQQQRANSFYNLTVQRRQALDKILGSTSNPSSPESVVAKLQTLAGTSSAADINKLRLARFAVGPSNWNDLSSSIIGKFGMKGNNFSGDQWLTDYGKLSPQGKDVLFGTTGTTSTNAMGQVQPLRQSLDDIASLAGKMKTLQKYGNTSGTTQSGLAAGEALGIVEGAKSVAKGVILGPLGALGTLLGGRQMAAFLSRPVTANMLDKWVRTYGAAAAAPSPNSAAFLSKATRALMIGLRNSGIGENSQRPTTY